MASYNDGKADVVAYILKQAKRKKSKEAFNILDVGACDGKWADFIQSAASRQEGLPAIRIDAVEAWKPNADAIVDKYDHVYNITMQAFEYRKDRYDCIIFGDVIEHMTVEDAQKVLEYARERCKEIIVGVPFRYPQGAIYGNPYEIHIQDDLTFENFQERYPGFELLFMARSDYAYFIKSVPSPCEKCKRLRAGCRDSCIPFKDYQRALQKRGRR